MLYAKDFENVNKIIFSSPLNKNTAKLTGRKIKIKEKEYIQFEHIHNNQAFHENITVCGLYDFFNEHILKYRQSDIFLDNSHYIAFNKNGNISFHKTKHKTKDKIEAESYGHNRRKNYIINEGDNIPVLIELGIFTENFKIVNSMYNKFKQINRFIELFDDMSAKIDEIYKKQGGINIIDFGCGKSYLTFILYYYFIKIKKFPESSINMTGIDLKSSVIENCNFLAKKYGYKNLMFKVGDINGYILEFTPNIAVSLHGCDTATDYALYNAVTWQADIIFAAPCCEHEINSQINIESMRNILKYGVIKERFSSILTNSIRCNILELHNYKTELIEFVDITHSPKNLLIRAVKINAANADKANKTDRADKSEIQKELEKTLQTFKINQKLYDLLK